MCINFVCGCEFLRQNNTVAKSSPWQDVMCKGIIYYPGCQVDSKTKAKGMRRTNQGSDNFFKALHAIFIILSQQSLSRGLCGRLERLLYRENSLDQLNGLRIEIKKDFKGLAPLPSQRQVHLQSVLLMQL